MSEPDAQASAPDYKYRAFLSYNHQDDLAVRSDGSGEPMPERFLPIFRDEAGLPIGLVNVAKSQSY